MKKQTLKQILARGIVSAGLLFSGASGPALMAYMIADGLAEEKPFQSWNISLGGKPLYEPEPEHNSSLISRPSINYAQNTSIYQHEEKIDLASLEYRLQEAETYYRNLEKQKIRLLEEKSNSKIVNMNDFENEFEEIRRETIIPLLDAKRKYEESKLNYEQAKRVYESKK